MDAERESGLSTITALAAAFKVDGDTNALVQLCTLVEDPKFGANATATIRGLSSGLNPAQIDSLVVPALGRGLIHTNRAIRREAALTTIAFAKSAKPVVGALRKALRDEGDVSVFAAQALGRIGGEASSAIPDLVAVLDSRELATGGFEDGSVRVYAVEALGRIGLRGAEIRDRLERALSDENPFVRVKSAQALIQNRAALDRPVDLILRQLKSNDIHQRRFILGSLAELSTIPTPIVAELRKLASDPDSEIREAARSLLR